MIVSRLKYFAEGHIIPNLFRHLRRKSLLASRKMHENSIKVSCCEQSRTLTRMSDLLIDDFYCFPETACLERIVHILFL